MQKSVEQEIECRKGVEYERLKKGLEYERMKKGEE